MRIVAADAGYVTPLHMNFMVESIWGRTVEPGLVMALEAQGKTVYLYGIEELGGLHYIYVLLRDLAFYGLPSAAELSSRSLRAYLLQMKELGKQFLKKVSSF